MNEVEWLASTDLHKMLEHLSGQVSDRKLRLFACACCRAMDRGGNTSGLAVVEMAEQVADGLLPLSEAVRLEPSVRRFMADTRALEADLSTGGPLVCLRGAGVASPPSGGAAALHRRQPLPQGEHRPRLAGVGRGRG